MLVDITERHLSWSFADAGPPVVEKSKVSDHTEDKFAGACQVQTRADARSIDPRIRRKDSFSPTLFPAPPVRSGTHKPEERVGGERLSRRLLPILLASSTSPEAASNVALGDCGLPLSLMAS